MGCSNAIAQKPSVKKMEAVSELKTELVVPKKFDNTTKITDAQKGKLI